MQKIYRMNGDSGAIIHPVLLSTPAQRRDMIQLGIIKPDVVFGRKEQERIAPSLPFPVPTLRDNNTKIRLY